jgi:hypothetical protein
MADKLEAKLGLNLDEFSKGLGDAKGLLGGFSKDLIGMTAGIGALGLVFKELKSAFLETEQGITVSSKALAVWKQTFADIINLGQINPGNLLMSISLAGRTRERVQEERQDRIDQKDIQNEINKALFQSYDNTKSRKEQEEGITKAMQLQSGLATMMAIDNDKDLTIIRTKLAINPTNEKLLNEENKLLLAKRDIEDMIYGLRRQQSRLTSMQKEDIKAINDLLRQQGQYLSTGYKTDTINTKNTSFGSLQMSNGTNWWEGLGLPYKASIDKKNASATPAQIEEATNAIKDQEQSVAALGKRFGQLFSGVNMGFQGMVDGMITGLKRLVMELIAEAAFLAILAAFGVIPISSIPTILGSMHGIKPGGIKGNPGGGAGVGVTPSIGMGQSNVTFEISGKSLVGVLKRN